MSLEMIEAVANAVLYEGYILYPYRPTAVKNRQRWTFGGLFPKAYLDAGRDSDPCDMQTQCLVQHAAETTVAVKVRFLHLLTRQVGELDAPVSALPDGAEPAYTPVEALEVNGESYYTWQEAREREVTLPAISIAALLERERRADFEFPASRELEPLNGAEGEIAGVLVRSQRPVAGQVRVAAETVAEDAVRVTVRIENLSPLEHAASARREQAQLQAMASTHTIVSAEQGAFISLLDPPERLHAAAQACDNQGTWPVLVGEQGSHDHMLSSPIILYDYPQVAPESPGDLFDGTEIDEILTLNILAMTDEEKREMASVEPRARALLERSQSLGPEDFQRLHGTLRRPRAADAGGADASVSEAGNGETDSEEMAPWVNLEAGSEERAPWADLDAGPKLAFLRVGDVDIKVGDHVRLRPKGGGDIMDLALAGKIAVIEGIERDFEDRVYVAVALDDDPGRDFGLERMPGHRFFFSPEEIEAVETGAPS